MDLQNDSCNFSRIINRASDWIEIYNSTVDYGDKTCNETKHGNLWQKPYIELLLHWKSLSMRHNISYFLVYGTLIGAVRSADFIPWDGDMDIMVDQDYYDIIANIDNNRNFVRKTTDPKFHLVVQNDFKQSYNDTTERRMFNCMGQVENICCAE